jgi:hypothetical protein
MARGCATSLRAAIERQEPLDAHVGRLAGKLAPKRAAR